MKHKMVWLVLGSLLMLTVSACDEIVVNALPTPTVVSFNPVVSFTPTEEPLPCPTQVVQTTSSTQIGRSNIAPPYEEIENTVVCIRRGSKSSLSEEVRNQITNYESRLLELWVNGWQGWVNAVGPGYMNETTYSLHIYMRDPFQDNRRGDARLVSESLPGEDDVQIDGLTQAEASKFMVGQKVRFSGSIYQANPYHPLAIRKASV